MAKDKQTAPKKKGAKPKAAKAETQKVAMVAIGASAGGLEPFERFFDAMPVNSDIAFVIIQHLSPDFESMMDELLSRHSSMDIERVVNDLKVRPNTIYLNPPRSKMIIKNGNRHILAWLRTILKSIFSSGYVTNTALILAITKKPL